MASFVWSEGLVNVSTIVRKPSMPPARSLFPHIVRHDKSGTLRIEILPAWLRSLGEPFLNEAPRRGNLLGIHNLGEMYLKLSNRRHT